MNQLERVAKFRQLHSRRPLILPNAWDAASARLIEEAGALAIATTSAGVSWSFGHSDGQPLHRSLRWRAETLRARNTGHLGGHQYHTRESQPLPHVNSFAFWVPKRKKLQMG